MFLKFVLICTLIGCSLSETGFENAIKKSTEYLERIGKAVSIPGIVAGVSINGTQVWTHAIGYTDIENDVKTRVDSVWRIGSMSKSLTSALVAKLIDEKRIDLNRPVYDYLNPSVFPIKAWNNKTVNITVGQIMSHTAGLHIMDFPNDQYKRLTFNNVTETLEPFKDEPLQFEPGKNFNYSNYGFQVTGAIIESVLNQTYESSINKMFTDLGMTSTVCERREQIVKHRSRYYMTIDSDGKRQTANTVLGDDLISFEAYWPAGGVISTVGDMLTFGNHMIKWSKGLNSTKSVNLSANSVNKMWLPVVNLNQMIKINSNDTLEYGHGWFSTTLKTPIICTKCKLSPIKQFHWHTGGIAGVNTMLLIEPQNEIVVTLFFNHIIDTNSPDSLSVISENILKNFIQ